jgi:Protein of unknown function (DUF3011)
MEHRSISWLSPLLGVWLLCPPAAAADVRAILCESPRQAERYCPGRTEGQVELLEQRSRMPCVEGRTWGYDAAGVWVRNGCRAWFRIGRPEDRAGRRSGPGHRGRLVCESGRRRMVRCPARTEGRVRLVQQLSDAPCVEGRTWGYDWGEVWVDEGCRAAFLVGRAATGAPREGEVAWDGGRGGDRMVTCESAERRYRRCPVRTGGRVDLLRRRSTADCVEGRSWGYDRSGVWVDQGCRADFRVGR